MAPAAASNAPAYEKNEKALCFHHELLYEAKILEEPQREDEKDKTSSWRYRVHYKGWKNTWDDWVPQDRLRKLTEDNRELAASLRRDLMQAESRHRNPKSTSSKKGRTQGSEIGSGRGSEERHSSIPASGRGTKRGKDNEIEKVSTPDFLPTPRRSSRMQSTGFSQSPLPIYPDSARRGSSQDDNTQAEASTPLFDLRFHSSMAAKSSKGGTFTLENAPAAKVGVSGHGIKTMALRTIHGRYNDEENPILSKPKVVARRGYFKDGKLSSPDLDAATSTKPGAGPRLSRRSERCDPESEKKKEEITMPDETTCTDDEMFEFVMDVLSRPPPLDEPEHMTVETFTSGHHWAPLIGGTSENERAQIEEEARQTGLWNPKRRVHPQYEKARINDPLNANRLHFFEHQDPDRILMIAGVPKDPINIDPPRSGTPFDALRYPDRLVQLPAEVLGNLTMTDLQKLDQATILRFPNKALRMLPPRTLSKLKIPIPFESDSNDECVQEEAFYTRPSVHFTVPDMIKGYLVDDWENVTKSLTLVELPSKAPVNWVLETYFHEEKGKRRLGSADADRLVEIIEGMKLYFEKMLGKTLLYKFERGQYAEVRKLWEAGKDGWEDKGPGDCYGVEHLCRLIASMPEWIGQTNMDAPSVAKVKEEMTLLNQWICRNHLRLFINHYERPSTEYIERAKE